MLRQLASWGPAAIFLVILLRRAYVHVHNDTIVIYHCVLIFHYVLFMQAHYVMIFWSLHSDFSLCNMMYTWSLLCSDIIVIFQSFITMHWFFTTHSCKITPWWFFDHHLVIFHYFLSLFSDFSLSMYWFLTITTSLCSDLWPQCKVHHQQWRPEHAAKIKPIDY